MTPLPLERLRLGWPFHLSALWWLGLLYRRPHLFCEALEELPKISAVVAGLVLLATAVPYIVAIDILFGLDETGDIHAVTGIAERIALGIALGDRLRDRGIARGIAGRARPRDRRDRRSGSP